MNRKISWLLALGLLLLIASTSVGTQAPVRPVSYLHPRLKAKEVKVRTVLLLPPIVTETKQGVKGSEGMAKEEDDATNALAAQIANDLKEAALRLIRHSPRRRSRIITNSSMPSPTCKRSIDEIGPQINRKPKDVRKGRFTLGDMVAVLNSKGSADALVFVRSNGVKLTKGKGMMTGGLVGLAASGKPTFTTTVTVVDARSGDVLFLDGFITSGLPKDKVFDKSFKKITAPK